VPSSLLLLTNREALSILDGTEDWQITQSTSTIKDL
jgi:hypothetical protein